MIIFLFIFVIPFIPPVYLLQSMAQLLYKDFLESLTTMAINDRFQIHSFTMIASDYKQFHETIIEAFDSAFPISVNTELVLLVLDSILKHAGSEYVIKSEPLILKWLQFVKKGKLVPKVIETWIKLPKSKSAPSPGPLFPNIVDRLVLFLKEYDHSVNLNSEILLSIDDFASNTNTKPFQIRDYINFYFNQIPDKCQQCGMRFIEESRFIPHLDVHYRANRRKQEMAIQIRRGWWTTIHEWINPVTIEDIQQQENDDANNNSNNNSKTQQEKPKEVKYCSVPSNRKEVFCFICTEKFDKFFNDEEEEWMLKNCQLVDNEYYHPACLQSRKKRKIQQ
eukprot:NODE_31_length_32452_cov_0.352672.p8 type:complete len:336 gc:universal NODE_31_length_32452_cov_0.352672:12803-13810(+)